MDNFVNHVRKNFSLYGFINDEMAVLQSSKELLENAFDAIKKISTDGAVSFYLSNDSELGHLVISVTDNGCGMEDVCRSFRCFSSSASDDADLRVSGIFWRFCNSIRFNST